MSFSPKFCIFLLNTIFDIIATLTWFAHMSFLCYKLCRGFYFQILVGFKFQEKNMWEGHTSTCIGLVRDFWGTFGCVSCIFMYASRLGRVLGFTQISFVPLRRTDNISAGSFSKVHVGRYVILMYSSS